MTLRQAIFFSGHPSALSRDPAPDQVDLAPKVTHVQHTEPSTDTSGFRGERHRRELQLHCYRMLGSLEDAEDAVQETLLRAWRSEDRFQGRAQYRTWLYAIATNVCLDALTRRPHTRRLPYDTGPAGLPEQPPQPGQGPWLEPCPESWLADDPEADPEAALMEKTSVELALMATIQLLPPRQRAALILRDLLDWPASEAAASLEMSVPALKSALQRARATLRQRLPHPDADWTGQSPPSREQSAVLHQYVEAMRRRDRDALSAVVRADLRACWPPHPLWTDGREDFVVAVTEHAPPGQLRYLETVANRQPAVAVYHRPPGADSFGLLALEVLRIEDGLVVEVVDFHDPRLLARTRLPSAL